MKGKNVLIIDDDPLVLDIARRAFEKEEVQVFTAKDAHEGLRKFYTHRPSMVVLDVMMDEIDGWEVCKQIRMLSDVPIIMLTSLGTDEDIIRGLDNGADDFVTKPFSTKVLISRSRAVLRRLDAVQSGEHYTPYIDSYVTIDTEKRSVRVRGESVRLTPTEYRLLAYLVKNAGRVLTYQKILENVWGWEYRDSIDYVHVYISHLRKKLEEEPKNPRYILSEHGWGYRFEKQK